MNNYESIRFQNELMDRKMNGYPRDQNNNPDQRQYNNEGRQGR